MRLGPERIVTSDLRRAVQTARIVAHKLKLPEPILDERLRERHWGERQGHSRFSNPPLLDHEAPVGGESRLNLQQRVFAAAQEYQDGTLIVTHAGPIRELTERWIQTPKDVEPGEWLEVWIPQESHHGSPGY
ncbi:MAG: histidine phosphatase family protein [Synechococcaceae cyanobacterium SM2_3_1]|nr:histidine phosphatase family protein [Synechococcaceae cyanobacterium SM2_3_1]